MKKEFMNQFVKKAVKGLCVGAGIIGLILIAQLCTDMDPLGKLSWYAIPAVFIVCLLYGTGWVFAYNLIKRSFRKMLRVDRNATIWQALTGKGMVIGLLYGMLCFIGGCILAMFVGNYFLVSDYFCVKQGKPMMSLKYKFDSDLEYNDWLTEVRRAVEYSDMASNASTVQRFNNDINLNFAEKGYIGTVTTNIKDGDKTIRKETKII